MHISLRGCHRESSGILSPATPSRVLGSPGICCAFALPCLASQGFDVVFVGDSFVERLRGTGSGGNVTFDGIKDVWDKYIGSKLKAGALGISGEQQTLWGSYI